MIRCLSFIRRLSSETMALDLIRYDILAQAALRGVVRTVLADAAKKGLPGEHHFKIGRASCRERVY